MQIITRLFRLPHHSMVNVRCLFLHCSLAGSFQGQGEGHLVPDSSVNCSCMGFLNLGSNHTENPRHNQEFYLHVIVYRSSAKLTDMEVCVL